MAMFLRDYVLRACVIMCLRACVIMCLRACVIMCLRACVIVSTCLRDYVFTC